MQFGQILGEVKDGGQLFKHKLADLGLEVNIRAYEPNVYLLYQAPIVKIFSKQLLIQNLAKIFKRETSSQLYLYILEHLSGIGVPFKNDRLLGGEGFFGDFGVGFDEGIGDSPVFELGDFVGLV